jgi:sugar (pentulose or hexulose) kinase
LVEKIADQGGKARGIANFDPYLAGDRCSVEQRWAAFTGLSLSTTREQMLAAIIESLARASAERLALLRWTGTPMSRSVMISGGGGGALAQIMHRDWPGRWKFKVEDEATMRGLELLGAGCGLQGVA